MAPAVRAAQNARDEGSTPDGPGAATAQEETMTTATKARTGRRLGRLGKIAAVGAVALTLAGAATNSADARPITQQAAGRDVSNCIGGGGDPGSYYFYGTYYITCHYSDGTWWLTSWSD